MCVLMQACAHVEHACTRVLCVHSQTYMCVCVVCVRVRAYPTRSGYEQLRAGQAGLEEKGPDSNMHPTFTSREQCCVCIEYLRPAFG
jgi:hypothetical protein